MPFAIDQVYVFYALAGISAALFAETVYLVAYSATSYRNRINRRLRLMKDEPDRESILIALRRERGLTTAGTYTLPFRWLNRLILQSGLSLGLMRFLLINAVAVAVVFGLVVGLGRNPLEAALAAVGFDLVGGFAVLSFLRARRHKRFGAQFPDALDIIVRSLRAGHPVPIAIAMVSRELRDPVGSEFGIASDETTYGADLETAMRNLYFRVGQQDLPLFVTAVAIQTSTGGRLSEILEELAGVIRTRFKLRRKVKALAAEGRFSAIFLSLVPFALFLLLNVVAPDFYTSVWDKDATKHGLAAAGAWMMIGNLIMYRMVNFKI